jgi:hypothetical protein
MSHPVDCHDFMYVQADIPAGTTIADWRAARAVAQCRLRRSRRALRPRLRWLMGGVCSRRAWRGRSGGGEGAW